MKSLTLTLFLLGLAAPLAAQDSLAQTAPWANKFFSGKAEKPPPIILHDFKDLPKGTVKTYRFKMVNIYAVPMQVSEPKPNCGCVSILEYTGEMKPNDTGYIDIRVDTSRVEGPKRVEIPVLFRGWDKAGQPFQSVARLEVRVNSRADIAVNPGLFNFGQVPAGQKATATVVVSYNGAQPNWAFTEIGLRKELFDHDVKPVNVRGAQRPIR
jgi:hypothetical protein